MSTIGYESWAVDLADVGAVYPFQGGEVLMVILGVAFWIAFHVITIRAENAQLRRLSDRTNVTDEDRVRSVERY